MEWVQIILQFIYLTIGLTLSSFLRTYLLSIFSKNKSN